jgi:hypothetical protein
MRKVRLNLDVSETVDRMLDQIADEAQTTKADVFRQALALVKAAHDGKRQGRHLGFVRDASKLDQEIVGLL